MNPEKLIMLADACIFEYFEKARGSAVMVRPGKWLIRVVGSKANGQVRRFVSIIIQHYSEVEFNGRRFRLERIEKNPLRLYYTLDNGDNL